MGERLGYCMDFYTINLLLKTRGVMDNKQIMDIGESFLTWPSQAFILIR